MSDKIKCYYRNRAPEVGEIFQHELFPGKLIKTVEISKDEIDCSKCIFYEKENDCLECIDCNRDDGKEVYFEEVKFDPIKNAKRSFASFFVKFQLQTNKKINFDKLENDVFERILTSISSSEELPSFNDITTYIRFDEEEGIASFTSVTKKEFSVREFIEIDDEMIKIENILRDAAKRTDAVSFSVKFRLGNCVVRESSLRNISRLEDF